MSEKLETILEKILTTITMTILILLKESDSAAIISNMRVIKAEDSESNIIIEWKASDPDGDDLT